MDYITYIRKMVGHNKIIMNAAACIIVNAQNEVLLQLRGDDHFWGLPGGIMELGETPEETCRREVLEETGLTLGDITLLDVFANPHKRWPNGDLAHILCHVFVCRETTGDLTIDGDETLDLRYFNQNELPTINAVDHLMAIRQYYS